ncbi:MAG: Ig-like domain-containing protein, partial [Acidobacteria bacterium]|nr:Ig-like domain-containing protein [Acidobacteriota bacterium]
MLILGGVGKDGAIGQAPEVFDPESLTFHSLPEGLPTPRAFHTATLLVDGRVIIAGGVGRDGSTLAEVEMWDSRSRSFQRSALLLPAPRSRHTAALLGDGGMLIGGGVAANGEPVAAIDVYDPRRDAFRSRPDAVQAEQPGLAESIPGDGATNVPLSTIIGLRFAVPVRVETANTTTVSIRDGQGSPVAAKIVPAEGGMLLFLVPSEPLRPGVNYAVMLDGLSGIDGAPLRFAQLAFTTATAEPLVSPAVPVSSIPNAVSSRTVAGAPSLAAVSGAGRRYSPTYPTWSPPTTPGPKCGNDSNYEGDPVDCATGIFVHTRTDLYLPDVMPISLTRTYRSGDSAPRPFGLGTSHPYEIFIWLPDYPDTYLSADLYLADGAKFHYTRITPGTEAANTAMEHTSTPGAFYKSRIETNNGASWFLTLRDGTQYTFIMSTTYPPVPTSIRDRNGNQITITRVVTDPARQGDIKRITSPSGRYIEFSYDSQHRIVEARDNIGRIVKYEYGGFYGNVLTKVTDPDGGVTEYTYTTDGNARMLTVRDARGIVHVTNEYDANGRVSRQMLVDGAVWTYAYTLNHQGNVKSSDATNPRGTVIKKTFNSDGYTLTDTLVSGRDQIKTTFDRQAVTNLVTRVTDPLGRKTDYTYDTCGNVASITRAAGTQQAVTTTFAYQVGSTCVAAPSLLASVTDPLSHATTFGYDAKGNVTSITNPLTNQTTLTYNGAGQPLTVRNALQKTWQFTYTSGDLTTVTDPLQRTTNQVIDFAGRVASVTNPFGQASFHEYDPLNRLRKLTDPLIGATEFSYDANGNLLSLKDARNGSTGYAYDNMDRPASRTDPLLRVESYLYDLNGNVTRFTDRKSQITNYSYDAFDRLTQVAYQDGSTTSYTYDLAGRITQVTDSVSGTITFTYDSLNRLTQDVTPQGTVSYTYDAAGRRTSMTAAGQAAVNYSYDNADRLTQITQGTNTVAFTYDVGDQRTSTTLPNGIVMAY